MSSDRHEGCDDADRRILANIEEYGCAVMQIAEEDDLPPFAYSVGITRTAGAPEVIIIGLAPELAHFVVNEYNHRVRQGERFAAGERYPGFIGDFELLVQKVDRSHYREYFGYNLWLYQGADFEVLQLVYPSTSGVWPWEPEASEWFRNQQPLLDQPATA